MNEKNIQQSANELVTALVNTLGKGTIQDVVKKNFDDALDIDDDINLDDDSSDDLDYSSDSDDDKDDLFPYINIIP